MSENKNIIKKQKQTKRKKKPILTVICAVIILISIFILSYKILNKRSDIVDALGVINSSRQAGTLKEDGRDKISDRTDALKQDQAVPKLQQVSLDEAYESAEAKKIAYLTFDDGPSKNVTPVILNTLKKYNIKATFFTIGSMAEQSPELIKKEHDEGHVIGSHTYSHNNSIVYSTPEACIADFNKGEAILKGILSDYNCKLVRFPGGAFDSDTKRLPFRQAVVNAGYRFYNWNCSDSDSDGVVPMGGYPPSVLLNNVKNSSTIKGKPAEKLIILMHDAPAKVTTGEALPSIIEYLKSQGYVFKTLQ